MRTVQLLVSALLRLRPGLGLVRLLRTALIRVVRPRHTRQCQSCGKLKPLSFLSRDRSKICKADAKQLQMNLGQGVPTSLSNGEQAP